MTPLETTVALFFGALTIALIAKRLDQPYPVALVVGGLVLSFVPGIPKVALNPEVVFYLLLPPILTEAAYLTSWRDFWRWKRQIFLLAFGLVAATSALVAWICVHFLPGMTWSAGFVLGSIISPPDAAAATSITRGLRLPKRITQILEGESLVNDAAGLTLYRFAVAAVMTGAFSLTDALLTFLWIALGGAAIGIVMGWGFTRLFPLIKDSEVEVLSTFILGYMAYFTAEALDASGVLAAVAAGLILGWYSPRIFSAGTRMRATAVWQSVIFIINVTIFFLIGLQLPEVMADLSDYPPDRLALWTALIAGSLIVIRLAWVFVGAYLPRLLLPSLCTSEPDPTVRATLIVGWTGLRGVVSLAAALALPMETETGLPFPYRSLILSMTFTAILITLVIQGMTLRPLVRWLRLPRDHSSEEEQLRARIYSMERVLERVEEMDQEHAAPGPVIDRVRSYFLDRLADYQSELEAETGTGATERPEHFQSLAEQRIWWELTSVERNAVIELRTSLQIGDEALREIEREIDLLESRIVPRRPI